MRTLFTFLLIVLSQQGTCIQLFIDLQPFDSSSRTDQKDFQVNINPLVRGIKEGETLEFSLPDNPDNHYQVNRVFNTRLGHTIIIAKGYQPYELSVLTLSSDGRVVGMLQSHKSYQLTRKQGLQILRESFLEGRCKKPREFLTKNQKEKLNEADLRSSELLEYADPTNLTKAEIDIFAYYQNEMEDPLMKIDQAFAVANLAYNDSGILIELRLAGALPTALPEDGLWYDVPLLFISSEKPPFKNVGEILSRTGADFVTSFWIRSDNTTPTGGAEPCGAAMLAKNWANPDRPNLTFHTSSAIGCPLDHTFAHEIGHNLGSMHGLPVDESTDFGIFSYSVGYRKTNLFSTVMSYGTLTEPVVGRFSSPDVVCASDEAGIAHACGVEIGSEDEADNVTSHNQVRFLASAIRDPRSSELKIESNVSPATTCKPVDASNSSLMQWRETGLVNASSDSTIPIACPISFQTFNAVSVPLRHSSIVELHNNSTSSSEVECSIHQYVGERFIETVSNTNMVMGKSLFKYAFGELQSYSPDLSNYTITCDLPPQTAITSIETRAVY